MGEGKSERGEEKDQGRGERELRKGGSFSLLIHITNLLQPAEQAQTVFLEHTGRLAGHIFLVAACTPELRWLQGLS